MLLDLQLQSGQCLDVIDQVKQCMPLVEVVATSIDDDEALAMLAFEKGATGYLVKSSWFVSYGDAILEVVHGGAPVTASITRRLLPRLRNGAGARGARLDGRASQGEECLTLREQEVFEAPRDNSPTFSLISQQPSFAQIARDFLMPTESC